MISYLKGQLVAKTLDSALVEVSGIGYEVGMSAKALAKLPELGEQVLVHTYLQVREDAWALFGFLSAEEKALFCKMITVSGVGPKVALSALSVFTPNDLVAAVTAQDIDAVTRIPGIGKKTASRIVLELKGSLDADLFSDGAGAPQKTHALQGATEALLSMGFTTAEAELSLKGAPEGGNESALLQYALKRLGQ